MRHRVKVNSQRVRFSGHINPDMRYGMATENDTIKQIRQKLMYAFLKIYTSSDNTLNHKFFHLKKSSSPPWRLSYLFWLKSFNSNEFCINIYWSFLSFGDFATFSESLKREVIRASSCQSAYVFGKSHFYSQFTLGTLLKRFSDSSRLSIMRKGRM